MHIVGLVFRVMQLRSKFDDYYVGSLEDFIVFITYYLEMQSCILWDPLHDINDCK